MRRWSFGAALIGVALLAVGVQSAGAATGTAPLTIEHPSGQVPRLASAKGPLVAIVSFRASAARVPYRGAPITLTVQVRNARRCTFYGQKTSVSSIYPLQTVSCRNGRVSVLMPAVPNRRKAVAQLWYQVRVRGVGARTVRRTVIVREDAAPSGNPASPPASTAPTATLSLSVTNLPAAGGHVDLTISSTAAVECTLGSNPALWSTANPASVDCNGEYGVDVPASSTARQWTITFTAANAAGRSATSTQTLTQSGSSGGAGGGGGGGFVTSTNWSGYILPAASIFTEAGGSWTVPTLNCQVTPNAGVGVWVGIGGADGSTLLQTGTTSVCSNGVQANLGWTEEYPSNPNYAANFASFPVTAGNVIQANVFETQTGQWETRVDNLSTGLSGVLVTGVGWGVMTDGATTFTEQGSATGLSYAGADTAEWIAEAFESAGSQVQCADFGTLTFSNLTTSLPGWSLAQATGTVLDQGSGPIATPSAPAGNGFSITYGAGAQNDSRATGRLGELTRG